MAGVTKEVTSMTKATCVFGEHPAETKMKTIIKLGSMTTVMYRYAHYYSIIERTGV